MGWETLRNSLEKILESKSESIRVSFYGGEPLLEFTLIQRAVDFLEERRENRKITYSISTNGILADENVQLFLDRYSFELQLSFDGIPPAQDIRGEGTFPILDNRIDSLRSRFPRFVEENLTVNLTITPESICYLVDSVQYFLQKGIKLLWLSPASNLPDPDSRDWLDALDNQFQQILDFCRQEYTPENIPVQNLKQSGIGQLAGKPLCGIVRGHPATVDVDGQVYACATVVPSYQKLNQTLISEWKPLFRIGHISDEDLAMPSQATERLKQAEILVGKQNKYSSLSKCRDCVYFGRCFICPVATARIPGNEDPNRVSDFICGFNRTSHKYQGLFNNDPFEKLRLAVSQRKKAKGN
jgi:sulfatase maturation enzyme AslB (radical SAM superfamily)